MQNAVMAVMCRVCRYSQAWSERAVEGECLRYMEVFDAGSLGRSAPVTDARTSHRTLQNQ